MSWTLAWVLWGAGALGSFLAIEVPAKVLGDQRQDHERRTATANIKWLFALDKAGARARWRAVRRASFLLLLGGGFLVAYQHFVG